MFPLVQTTKKKKTGSGSRCVFNGLKCKQTYLCDFTWVSYCNCEIMGVFFANICKGNAACEPLSLISVRYQITISTTKEAEPEKNMTHKQQQTKQWRR